MAGRSASVTPRSSTGPDPMRRSTKGQAIPSG
jgi:hypothetical protein